MQGKQIYQYSDYISTAEFVSESFLVLLTSSFLTFSFIYVCLMVSTSDIPTYVFVEIHLIILGGKVAYINTYTHTSCTLIYIYIYIYILLRPSHTHIHKSIIVGIRRGRGQA